MASTPAASLRLTWCIAARSSTEHTCQSIALVVLATTGAPPHTSKKPDRPVVEDCVTSIGSLGVFRADLEQSRRVTMDDLGVAASPIMKCKTAYLIINPRLGKNVVKLT